MQIDGRILDSGSEEVSEIDMMLIEDEYFKGKLVAGVCGEGHFLLEYPHVGIRIRQRADNPGFLEQYKRVLGGKIYPNKETNGNPSLVLSIEDTKVLAEYVVPIFDDYRKDITGNKGKEYDAWRMVVMNKYWLQRGGRRKGQPYPEWYRLLFEVSAKLAKRLRQFNGGRLFMVE